MASANADKMGSMNIGNLGTYLKGYFNRSMEVFDMGVQQAGFLGGVFPVRNLEIPKIELRWQAGVAGRMNVALDAPVEDSRWEMKETSKELTWDKFSFSITDSATDAIAVNNMAATGMRNAAKYFAALRDYRIITELKAKHNSNCTAAADAYWTADTAQVESDIVTAIQTMVDYSGGLNPETARFGVIYPAKAMMGLDSLGLIGNVQMTVKEYLKKTWNMNFYPYSPWKTGTGGDEYIDVKNDTSSDALGTSALVFVEGEDTLVCGQYRGSGIKLVETTRIHDVGYKTTLRNSFGCLAKPLYDDTTFTTPLIYEISNVTSS